MNLTEYTEDQKARIVKNLDTWISSLTGSGVSGIDKFTSFGFSTIGRLDDATLEELYTDDDLAATIVERKVHDALRSGYLLDWKEADDLLKREVVDWAESEYAVTEETKQARIYSRLYGGGAIHVGVEGAPGSQAILGRDVGFVRAVSSKDLRGETWYNDPNTAEFGQVATYKMRAPTFQPSANGRTMAYAEVTGLHYSRFIPFYGIRISEEQMWEDRGWGKSVLQRVYSVLMKFETSFDSVLHTLLEQSIPRYKVKALLDLLASENGELLAKRFELINTAKSAYRAVIMDIEEEFDRVEANLGPSSQVVDSAMIRVAGAAGMPVTILFGREPAGQNATGKSDLENWNQQVASEQSLVLGPAIAKVYRFLLAQQSSPLKGEIPEGFKVTFPAVETPSLQDQVNLYAQRAGADKVYYDMRAVTAAEIARKRSQEPGGQFPSVDLEFLEELDEMAKERILEPPEQESMAEPQDMSNGQPEDDDTAEA